MELIHRSLRFLLVAVCCASAAIAQDRQADQTTPNATTVAPANGPSLTGKERMGRKWMDEQRIDDCNVPIDKRGNRPRPPNCMNSPSG